MRLEAREQGGRIEGVAVDHETVPTLLLFLADGKVPAQAQLFEPFRLHSMRNPFLLQVLAEKGRRRFHIVGLLFNAGYLGRTQH